MTQIGNIQFTQPLLHLTEQDTDWLYIGSGGDEWCYTAKNPGSGDIAVTALISQGYSIVSKEGRTYTLQLTNPNTPENPGQTAAWQLNQRLKGGKSPSNCFVATACYGSYEHPDVMIFRRWRDQSLLTSPAGRGFVRFYYKVSPTLAAKIEKVPYLRNFIRKFVLEPFARILE